MTLSDDDTSPVLSPLQRLPCDADGKMAVSPPRRREQEGVSSPTMSKGSQLSPLFVSSPSSDSTGFSPTPASPEDLDLGNEHVAVYSSADAFTKVMIKDKAKDPDKEGVLRWRQEQEERGLPYAPQLETDDEERRPLHQVISSIPSYLTTNADPNPDPEPDPDTDTDPVHSNILSQDRNDTAADLAMSQSRNDIPWMCVYDLEDGVGFDWDFSYNAAEDSPKGNIERQTPVMPTHFLPANLQQVYSEGLLPYVVQWFDGINRTKMDNRGKEAGDWNGHLPLGPCSSASESATSAIGPSSTRTRQRRRHRGLMGQLGNSVHQHQQQQHKQVVFSDARDDHVEVVYLPQHKENNAPANAKRGEKNYVPGDGERVFSSSPAINVEVLKPKKETEHGNGLTTVTGGHCTGDIFPPPGYNQHLHQVEVPKPGADRGALRHNLAALKDVSSPSKRQALFAKKLHLCRVVFDFDDPEADKRGKKLKRRTLLELVDYINKPAGQRNLTNSIMPEIMSMVKANVCRALPSPPSSHASRVNESGLSDERETVLEPAWPHLQLVYEFLLRFIVSAQVPAKVAARYIDEPFCVTLLELTDSQDPRERDYLKTILHRIYVKFMMHRSFLRRSMAHVFYRIVYETGRHNGCSELLEIMGSIIHGFCLPLKSEHLLFLERALLPLHKPACLEQYHHQLRYCVTQYAEKDADTAVTILTGLFKYWPWCASAKQVLFLTELDEILPLIGTHQLSLVSVQLFTNLGRCLEQEHFQVVERTLFLWNNEHLISSQGCLSRLTCQHALPLLYGPLLKHASGHWNGTVKNLAESVLNRYKQYDTQLYHSCAAAHLREQEASKRNILALQDKWTAIEQTVMAAKVSQRTWVAQPENNKLSHCMAGDTQPLTPNQKEQHLAFSTKR